MMFLQEKQEFLEKETSELRRQLEAEMKVLRCHVLLTHTRFPFL